MTTGESILIHLQQYKIKASGPNQWRCNSPLRPGSNSHAFTLTIDPEGESGAYYDHVNDDSGSLYDLAQLLGIETPERATIVDTKRAYASLTDYAQAHGVSQEIYLKAGWSEVMQDNRPALKFSTQNGSRYRFLDGEKPYYKSPAGYKRCWYGLNTTTLQRLANHQSLIICNGEASTVAAQHFGLAACAITGGEKGEIPPDLLAQLQVSVATAIPIIVAFDCDPTGRDKAPKVEAQLRGVGYEVKAVDLGLNKGGDIADYCMLHGTGAAEALMKLPAIKPAQRGKLLNLEQMKQLPKPTWLIDREIPERGLVVLCGKSGIGKTFVLLDYMHKVARHKPVVFAALEGQYGIYSRAMALCKFNKVRVEDVKQHFWLDPLNMMDPDSLSAFMATINQVKPGMVIVDTLSRAMGAGDPNSPRDMSIFVNACQQIQQAIDGVVMLAHHARKGDGVYSGSSILYNSCETFLYLRREDVQLCLEADKVKDADPFDARYLRLIDVKLDDGDSAPIVYPADRVNQTQRDSLTPNQRKVIDAIIEYFPDGAQPGDLCDVTEIGKGSLLRTLGTLRRLGYVTQPKRFAPYQVTLDGRIKYEEKSKRPVPPDSPDSPDSLMDSSPDSPVFGNISQETRKTHSSSDSFSLSSLDSGVSPGSPGVQRVTEQLDLIRPPTRYE